MAFKASQVPPAPAQAPASAPTDPEARHLVGFYPTELASSLHTRLAAELEFRPDRLVMGGKIVETRRLVDFRGDAGIGYRYSGTHHQAAPWTPCLKEIADQMSEACHAQFNACLCNFYPDGASGVSWHSDDEPELGPLPTIASLSFGEPRLFRFRRKSTWRAAKDYQKWDFPLAHGDLLIMSGSTQHFFEHELPVRVGAKLSRINLTFRKVV